jgi:K+-transporting ATPase ATPase C chain
MNIMKTLTKSLFISLVLMIICGLIYPLAMTGISQLIFPKQANGSIIEVNGTKIGSELLGQSFTDPRFFRGRISAVNYNTYKKGDTPTVVSSGSSNLAPSNKALTERVESDMNALMKLNPGLSKGQIPEDLLTSSASGLDPDISPEAAKFQIPSISKATGISSSDLENIVSNNIEGRQLGIFGEPRVNVLKLNIEIANILKQRGKL